MGFGDQFLTDPALFPARFAGSPAGEQRLLVDVPGGPYLLTGLSAEQGDALRSRYGERCAPAGGSEAATRMRVYAAEPGEFADLDRDGRLNAYDFDYRESSVRMAGHQVMAHIRWQPSPTAALWTALTRGPRFIEEEFLEAFENCFRVLCAYRLLDLGGFVLHSSCVVDGGRAWVFFGHSGAGKTTIARRSVSEGRIVLSDDVNAIRPTEASAVVEKMPFAGELGRTNEKVGPFPLAAMSRLRKAPGESWRALSDGSAVAAVLSCVPFVNGDPHRLPVLLDNVERLVRATPTGVLELSLNGDPWAILETQAT